MSSESRIEIRLPNIDFQDNPEVEMIYIVIALCALVTAFFACRYYAAKILLVEHDIDKAIARKFEASGKAIELAKLREENAVMRNLCSTFWKTKWLFRCSRQRYQSTTYSG